MRYIRSIIFAVFTALMMTSNVSVSAQQITSRTAVAFVGTYNSATTYAKGDLVQYSGSAYVSLANANTGNTPTTATSFWQPIGSTGSGSGSGSGCTDATCVLNSLPIQEFTNVATPPLAYWDAAFHDCKDNHADVMIHGDSRSVVDSTYSGTLSVQFGKRWVDQLSNQLWGMCGFGGLEVPFLSVANGGNGTINPDYYTSSGTYTTDPALGPYQGGNVTFASVVKATSNGFTFTFSPGVPFDTLSCFGVSGTGLHPWTMKMDGATVGSCGGSSGSSPTAGYYPGATGTLSNHSVSLVCNTQPCEAYSLMVTAGNAGVRIHNYSVGSCAAECFGLNTATTQFAFSDLIPGGAALDIINVIANEPGVGYSTNSFQLALNQMIYHDRALSYPPSVLLIAPLQDNIGGQAPYYPIITSTARNLNTAYLDMRDRWGTSYVGFLEGSDTYHENNVGNGELYSAVAKTIIDVPAPTVSLTATTCNAGSHISGVTSSGVFTCSLDSGGSGTVTSNSCGSGYSHYASLSIANSSVAGGSDLLNFPVLFAFNGAATNSITLSNLKSTTYGGQVTSASGTDVTFCTASTGGVSLSYELVGGTYSPVTGSGEWYVKVPDLSSTTATTVYVFWGNSGAVTAANPTDVWSNGYTAVYHFGTATTLSGADSTANTNTLTGTSTGTAGRFGGGVANVPNATLVNSAPVNLPTGSSARTVEGWLNVNSFSGEAVYMGYGDNGGTDGAFTLDMDGGSKYVVWYPGNFSNDALFSTGAWHYVALTAGVGTTSNASPANTEIYVDGALLNMASGASTTVFGTPGNDISTNGVPGLANGAAGGNYALDEFRISRVARTSGWLSTQYANQSNPAGFVTVTVVN